MLPKFTGAYWSIADTHTEAFASMIAAAIKSGPIDDAESYGLPIRKQGRVAIVETLGPIIKQAGWMSAFGLAGTRDAQLALQSAAADDDAEEILWIMDTPGGSVDGLAEAAEVVRQVNAVKPITVQVDGMLASAGYFLASYASKIYAAPDNLIGSIGVRTALYDFSKMYEQAGVKAIPIDTGEHKSAGLSGTEITESQQAEFQRIVDGYMDRFVSVVMDGRGLSKSQLEAVADGRVFFPRESIVKGLIDGEQTLDQTIAGMTLRTQSTPARSAHKARLSLQKLRA